MTSVPDFSQATSAAAVERVTPPEGEPLTAAAAAAGTAGLAAPEPDEHEPGASEPDGS